MQGISITETNQATNEGPLVSVTPTALIIRSTVTPSPTVIDVNQDEMELTIDDILTTPVDYNVEVNIPEYLTAVTSSEQIYTGAITNVGTNADTYEVVITQTSNWVTLSDLPSTLTLGPGEVHTFTLTVALPTQPSVPETSEFEVTLYSQSNPNLVGQGHMYLTQINQ
jgi:hypothetical protein